MSHVPTTRRSERQLAFALSLILLAAPAASRAELYSIHNTSGTMVAHAEAADGNAAPGATLTGPPDYFNTNAGDVDVDAVHRELFVAGGFSPTVSVFALGATGGAAPLRVLTGPATGLSGDTDALALDLVHDELWVTVPDFVDGAVMAFPRGASGNVAPLRRLEGPATGLRVPSGVAVDPVNGEIFVTEQGSSSVRVFSRTANGNAAPKRVIAGSATGLGNPFGITFDAVRNEILVTDRSGAISAFARNAQGNVAPKRRIAGAQAGLQETLDIELLGDSELVVANSGPGGNDLTDDSLLVFPRGGNGNIVPRRRINGPLAQVAWPNGLAVGRRALLLGGGRFAVEATWRTSSGGIGGAQPVALTNDTGYLWFFGASNVEAVVKVLDACTLNNRFWVFAAGLTDVRVELTVTDLATGQVRAYTNPQGTAFQPILDTAAFATCGASLAAPPIPAGEGFVGRAGTSPRTDVAAACSGLCLGGDRFAVEATWRTSDGATGTAHGVEITSDTGYQWFFGPQNVETVVKVLDGCAVNGRYWVFAAGLTNVRVELTVRDTVTGTTKTYVNPQGTAFEPIQDTAAFATCP